MLGYEEAHKYKHAQVGCHTVACACGHASEGMFTLHSLCPPRVFFPPGFEAAEYSGFASLLRGVETGALGMRALEPTGHVGLRNL